jgi:hypothetical protein
MASFIVTEKALNKRVIYNADGQPNFVIVEVPLFDRGIVVSDDIKVNFDFEEWTTDGGQPLPIPKRCHLAHRSAVASADVRVSYDDLGGAVTGAWSNGNNIYNVAYYNTSINNFSANIYIRNTEMQLRVTFATAPTTKDDFIRLTFEF